MAHMDVLLREDVENLGHRGDVVRVRAGYGRNYLLPQGLATKATTGNKRMIEEQRRVLAKRETRERVSAQGEAEKLDGLEIRFDRRVGEHGILYGSVTALDVAEALKERGYTVERRRIGLRDHIKEVGDYDVVIKLHRDVTPTIKVRVRKEGAPDEPEVKATGTPETETGTSKAGATEIGASETGATETAPAADSIGAAEPVAAAAAGESQDEDAGEAVETDAAEQ